MHAAAVAPGHVALVVVWPCAAAALCLSLWHR
jgi:hypothetical protein